MCLTSYSPKISRRFPLSVFLNCSHLLSTCNLLDVQVFDIITVERIVELNAKDNDLGCDAVQPGKYLWTIRSSLLLYIFRRKINASGSSKTSTNFFAMLHGVTSRKSVVFVSSNDIGTSRVRQNSRRVGDCCGMFSWIRDTVLLLQVFVPPAPFSRCVFSS